MLLSYNMTVEEFDTLHKDDFEKVLDDVSYVLEDIKKTKGITTYIRQRKLKLHCSCGKIFERSLRYLLENDNRECQDCTKHNAAKLANMKREQTCLRKYGTKSPFTNIEVAKKIAKTNKEKYGHENPFGSKKIQEQIKQTNLSKYGRDNVGQFGTEEHREAMIEKYGVAAVIQRQDFKDRIKQTCLDRYGYEHAQSAEEVKSRTRKTCLERYGAVTNLITQKYHAANLEYDNIVFDSKAEIEFYKKCKEHELDIIRAPCSFEYYVEGSVHTYYPDFSVNGHLIEIKGDFMLNEKGELLDWHQNRTKGSEEKQKCMLLHNVIMIKASEIDTFDYETLN